MKSLIAIVLCVAIPVTVLASDGGYKVTYDGGSIQDVKAGTGEGTFLEYPLKPVQLDSGRDRRLGVQFWSSSGISVLYRIMPGKSASPPKTR